MTFAYLLASHPLLWAPARSHSSVRRLLLYIFGPSSLSSNHEFSRTCTVNISRGIDTAPESCDPSASRAIERT